MKILLFFIICILLSGCTEQSNQKSTLSLANNGSIDLQNWNFEKEGTVSLEGEWKFYWEQLFTPSDLQKEINVDPVTISVPSYWATHENLTNLGYATYNLTIQIPEESIGKRLAFYMPMAMTSYQLWIDGELASHNGIVGITKAEGVPKYIPLIIPHQPTTDQIDIILQVSNFHHRDGGIWESLVLGTYSDIKKRQDIIIVTELILFGGLLIAGGYHLSIFCFRRKEKVNFYFGFLCLLIASRISVTGEVLLYQLFPDLNWAIGTNIEYIGFYLSVGMTVLFIHSMYPHESSKRVSYSLVSLSLLFTTIVLFSTTYVFSHTLKAFNVIAILGLCYCIFILLKAAKNNREGAKLTIFLFGIFTITITNDILYNLKIISTFLMTPFGLLFIIFGQSVILSIQQSRAFNRVEELSKQQQQWQHELEHKVQERTLDLQTALQTLKETQFQLVEGEKMRSLGNLVAGVAHEINTPLGISVTASSHLAEKTTEITEQFKQNKIKKSDLMKYLTTAEEAMHIIQPNLHRASELIRSFKQVAVDQSNEYERKVNLKDYLEEIIYSLKPNIKKENVNVRITCDDNLFLHCNPGDLSQVITNLVMNSIHHAFTSGQTNKDIHIVISSTDHYVTLQYSDNGVGMDENTKKHIFEPFFTTKRGQGGSGLGMHLVYNIVNQALSGKITCHSEKNVGTTFTITIPYK